MPYRLEQIPQTAQGRVGPKHHPTSTIPIRMVEDWGVDHDWMLERLDPCQQQQMVEHSAPRREREHPRILTQSSPLGG